MMQPAHPRPFPVLKVSCIEQQMAKRQSENISCDAASALGRVGVVVVEVHGVKTVDSLEGDRWSVLAEV